MSFARALNIAQVQEIVVLLDAGISLSAIAAEYKVAPKTIDRINKGITWFEVTHRKEPRKEPHMIMESDDLLTKHDMRVAVNNHFGFSGVINWGIFRYKDGLHYIATDGKIMWESRDLVKFSQDLPGSKELSSYSLKSIMTLPLGNVLAKPSIDKKYIDVASKMHLSFHTAGNSQDFIYLARKNSIFACVVTK